MSSLYGLCVSLMLAQNLLGAMQTQLKNVEGNSFYEHEEDHLSISVGAGHARSCLLLFAAAANTRHFSCFACSVLKL